MGSKDFLLSIFCTIILLNISLISSNVVSEDEKTDREISIIIGPYPQNTDLDSAYIIWQTNITTVNNSVHFGFNPDCDNILYENINSEFHKIELDELKPSTEYYYKVVSDEIESDVYMFHTSFEVNESVKFIAYGDTRGVWDNWRSASIVAKSIKKEQPYFALHTGDFVKNGLINSQWVDFFSISNFTHNCTIYPVLGNHEYYGDSYFQYFTIPGNGYWYSFDNGPIHFIGLDSNKKNLFNPYQIFWLFKDLMSNCKPYTIVFFHHPPYSSGNHGSTNLIRLLWVPLFSIFNVDIVFNGHDHSYERGLAKDVNFIVTGGGGAPLYNVKESWWTIYSEKTHHYCLIAANQSQLSFQAIKPDGDIIDSFIIENQVLHSVSDLY